MYARVTRVSASRFTVHCMARFEERRRNVLAQAPADGARIGGGSLIRDAVRRFGPGPRVPGFGPGPPLPAAFSWSNVNELRWGDRSPGATVAG